MKIETTSSEVLNNEEVARYSRHLILPEFGLAGQQALKSSRVLFVGAGGLGSPCLLYLAAAGVGTIGIIDFDVVDTSNLQRQVIHGMADVGRKKIESARDAILAINPHVQVELFDAGLSKDNALDIISGFDLVLDGTDNFPTRYLVNDACVLAGKPYVWGSIYRFEGQVSVFWEQAPDGRGINYRDLYPEPPPPEYAPSCSEGGVLGVLCAAIGSIMATEAIKLIAGMGDSLLGTLMVYDALGMTFRKFPIHKAEDRFVPDALVDYEYFCAATSLQTPAESAVEVETVDVHWLSSLLNSDERFHLIDVREKGETDIVKLDQAVNIPSSDLSLASFEGYGKDERIVVMCKSGARSLKVARLLVESGYSNVSNLDGGIISWVREVETDLPVY